MRYAGSGTDVARRATRPVDAYCKRAEEGGAPPVVLRVLPVSCGPTYSKVAVSGADVGDDGTREARLLIRPVDMLSPEDGSRCI